MRGRLHLVFLRFRCVLLLTLPGVFLPPLTAAPPSDAPASARSIVHVVEDPKATRAFDPEPAVVRRMVDAGLQALANTNSSAAAWSLFIKPTDVVGFRVISSPGAITGTRPAVVAALAESLIAAGHPPRQIVVWDKRASDLILAGYPKLAQQLGIRWSATEEAGWDEEKFYDNATIGRLLIGDFEFPRRDKPGAGRKSFVSRLLTRDVTKIVLVTPLLNHNLLGVHGQIAGLSLGAVDNTMRFEQEAGRLAEAVPEICALDDLFPHLAFGVTDALVCQYRGEERTLLHYAVTLNQLRFSTDPVALDFLSLEEIEKARKANPAEGEKPFATEVYSNASLLEMGAAEKSRIEVRPIPLRP